MGAKLVSQRKNEKNSSPKSN